MPLLQTTEQRVITETIATRQIPVWGVIWRIIILLLIQTIRLFSSRRIAPHVTQKTPGSQRPLIMTGSISQYIVDPTMENGINASNAMLILRAMLSLRALLAIQILKRIINMLGLVGIHLIVQLAWLATRPEMQMTTLTTI